jgi:hypothetical protein
MNEITEDNALVAESAWAEAKRIVSNSLKTGATIPGQHNAADSHVMVVFQELLKNHRAGL